MQDAAAGRRLRERQEAVVAAWRAVASPPGPVASGPAERALDRFLEAVVDRLAGGDERRAAEAIAELMRLRAVQGVEPSRAVLPLAQLEPVLRAELGAGELAALEPRVDALRLEVVRAYTAACERLAAVRASELRRSDRVAQAVAERARARRENAR